MINIYIAYALKNMNLKYTNTVYKTFFKAVPLDHSGAGFHFLKQSILIFNYKDYELYAKTDSWTIFRLQ